MSTDRWVLARFVGGPYDGLVAKVAGDPMVLWSAAHKAADDEEPQVELAWSDEASWYTRPLAAA